MGDAATAMKYCHSNRTLYVGLNNGTITEFLISDDGNKMDHVRDYHAHQGRVTGVQPTSDSRLLSVARDRYFQCHNSTSGQRLGGYLCSAWCTALAYDEDAKYAFIGDYSGQITICQLSENGVKLINVLKGHNGSIQTLHWDGTQGWLYSGL
jgi:WD40 repeat protein